jgi:hypothetical protein
LKAKEELVVMVVKVVLSYAVNYLTFSLEMKSDVSQENDAKSSKCDEHQLGPWMYRQIEIKTTQGK